MRKKWKIGEKSEN